MTLLTAPDELELLANSPVAPMLRLRRSGERERDIQLSAGKCTVGSSPQCQVCLPSPDVRPLQCLITLEANAASVTRWAAGVKLNGRDFSKAALANGDRLSVGDWEIEYSSGNVAETASDLEADWPTPAPVAVERPAVEAPTLGKQPATTPERLKPAVPESMPIQLAAPTTAPEPALLEVEVAASLVEQSAPAGLGASQSFQDRLVLHLWVANDRTRRRAKALVNDIRAARFQADSMAADLAAMETELDLARAAYDLHIGNDDRQQLELAENRREQEERVASLLEEIAGLRAELEGAQVSLDRRIAEYDQLSSQLTELRQSCQPPVADPAAAEIAGQLEAKNAVQAEQLAELTSDLKLARREQERLIDLHRVEAERVAALLEEIATLRAELEAARASMDRRAAECDQLSAEVTELRQTCQTPVVDSKLAERTEQLETTVAEQAEHLAELTRDLEAARQEQQRLVELHRVEAERAAQFEEAFASEPCDAALEEPRREGIPESPPDPQQANDVWQNLVAAEDEASEPVAESTTWEGSEPEAKPIPIQPEMDAVTKASGEIWNSIAALPEAEAEPVERAEFAKTQAAENALEEPPLGMNRPQRPAAPEAPQAPTWAAPASDPSGSEYSSTSFIDKYRHLLEDDDARMGTTLPKGSRPVIDQEYLSPAKAEIAASPADDSDEALEAYMANMMRRVRSNAPSYESSQAAAPESHPNYSSGVRSYQRGYQTAETIEATPADAASPDPISFEQLKQATRKVPLASDLAALREIANSSARTAIAKHAKEQTHESAVTRLVIAVTAAVAAAYLMSSSPALTEVRFWSGVGACAVGVVAAVQVFRIERGR